MTTLAAVVSRSCCFTALVFAVLFAVAASAPAATQPATDPAEDARHAAALRKIAGDRIDANTRYENGKIRCRHVDDKDCIHKLEVQNDVDLRQIVIEGYQEDGTHTKSQIDFNRRQQAPKFSGAQAAENLRHYNAETDLQKRAVDADVQYKIDKIKCDVYDLHDQAVACRKQAALAYADNLDQITIARNNENALHTKNLMNVNAGAPSK